jgi:hypothetical protein
MGIWSINLDRDPLGFKMTTGRRRRRTQSRRRGNRWERQRQDGDEVASQERQLPKQSCTKGKTRQDWVINGENNVCIRGFLKSTRLKPYRDLFMLKNTNGKEVDGDIGCVEAITQQNGNVTVLEMNANANIT